MKIGIITTSIRSGRVGLDVASWVRDYAKSREDKNIKYSIVDLANYDLPMMGSENTTEKQMGEVVRWQKDIAELDGYVFVVAEYNHAVTGAIKNATDFLKFETKDKPAAFVGYGGLGGIRAIENLRVILAELQLATVQKTVNFLLAVDFENYTKFAPKDFHKANAEVMFDQFITWTSAFKAIR